ncbi:MAG: hypothetical protein IJ015_01465 [Ruminococcus sp.]|nr:hypothetical protein [Ruminococcus sp.]
MNRRIKVLSVIATLLMLFVAVSINVYATAGIESPSVEVTPTDAPVIQTDPPVIPTDTPVTPTSGEIEPTIDPGVTDPTTGGGEQESSDDNYYNDDDGDDFYFYDEDEMVNSIENSAGSVKENTDLYDTSDLNKSELKETKWDNITLDTSKKDAEALDFSAIKDNTKSDDDSTWIIYTGFILIGLSIIGIMYFIIATSTYKKKLNKLNQRQAHHNSNRARDDYGDYSNYPTQSDYNRRYNQKKRYASDGMGYAERKRMSKANTAEIDLPSKYRARH